MSDDKPALTFFDTNILFYADDTRNPEKQRLADSLIRTHRENKSGVVSLQVLQEYFVNVCRKLSLDPAIARRKVEIFTRFHLVEPAVSDVLAAIDFHRLHQVSYWDALVIHCARKSGCRVVLTEDLQHGQEFDGVKIVNPFL
ncbi:MAG TPA: PIN domain-containing protein [Terracidiphilus sp.]|jgi:predicted nucleic acid-binding protein